jgi:energy-coupling factor transporter ATP-binding protein EcfA2
MKLRKLQIQNFRAIRDLTLSFEDPVGRIRPITVLAGPNGCGKTSVVFAIVQALRGEMGYRTEDVPEPKVSDIHQAGGAVVLTKKPLSGTPVQITVKVDVEFDDTELKSIPQIFKETEDLHNEPLPPPLQGGRVSIEWKYPPERSPDGTLKPSWRPSKVEPWLGFRWLHGRRHVIRGWLNHSLSSPRLLFEVGGICLFPQDRNLRSRVVGEIVMPVGRQSGVEVAAESEEQPVVEERIPSERIISRSRDSVWGILQYLGGYAALREKKTGDEGNWEKRIQEQFNRICAPRKYLGFRYQLDDPVGAPYFKDGDKVYSLDMAASGEQVIIEYITRLTYPSPTNHSLILIDEPEVHLHPGWIRQLYRALPLMGEANQYILTTHSTELRGMAAEDGVLIDMGELAVEA